MKNIRGFILLLASALIAGLGGRLLVRPSIVSAATAGDVIINEIMYNPQSGNQNDEYLELYNTTGSPIDLGNWSFSAGITLTFTGGTMIPANGYLVVSPSIAQTLTTYGVVAAAQYSPSNLSNGGETVTLIDDSANVISSVSYDDASPWPTSPDGFGPSLELKDTSLDPSQASNWAASISAGGTPLAVNSVVGLTLPSVSSVTDPNGIGENTAVTINATVTGAGITGVNLLYKTNFDSDVTLQMFDDGAHDDGAAADDVYGAEIPGQSMNTLVRFRVEATNASGTQSSPSVDDAMDYNGYYVKDPSITSNAPILEWFIPDADFTDMVENHFEDNMYFNCVVVYGDDVYDAAKVRVRGEVSRYDPKKPFKFKLPSGSTIQIAGGDGVPTGEFEMLHNYYSNTAILPSMNWVSQQAGLKVGEMLPARLQRNGAFEGLYVYANKFQSQWRQANGFNNGELYDETTEIVNGANDFSRVNDLQNNTYSTSTINSAAQKEYVLDNFDIPNIFNFMSNLAAAGLWDQAADSNTLQYFDYDTQRWSLLIWDREGNFQKSPTISAYDARGSRLEYCWTYCPVYNQPELRELYLRRLRTIIDKLYPEDQLTTYMQQIDDLHAADRALDIAKWGQPGTDNVASLIVSANRTKNTLLNYLTGFDWAIPPAQQAADEQQVSFDTINPDADDGQEYIRISNTADTPVDISGWTIDELNFEIPEGVVVPANGTMLIVRDDIAYKAAHTPTLIMAQYDNDLGNSGTLTLRNLGGDVIDTESY